MISDGHAPGDVLRYTPRQVAAFVFIATQRRRREMAEQLQVHSVAAQGEGKTIREMMKELGADDG